MTRFVFEEVKVKGVRRWTGEDGKRHQETKTFMQTVNPFNKHANGTVKSREDIKRELIADLDFWLLETSAGTAPSEAARWRRDPERCKCVGNEECPGGCYVRVDTSSATPQPQGTRS